MEQIQNNYSMLLCWYTCVKKTSDKIIKAAIYRLFRRYKQLLLSSCFNNKKNPNYKFKCLEYTQMKRDI